MTKPKGYKHRFIVKSQLPSHTPGGKLAFYFLIQHPFLIHFGMIVENMEFIEHKLAKYAILYLMIEHKGWKVHRSY